MSCNYAKTIVLACAGSICLFTGVLSGWAASSVEVEGNQVVTGKLMVGVSSTTYSLEVSGGVRLATPVKGYAYRSDSALTAISGNGQNGPDGPLGENGLDGGSGGHITIAAGSAGEGGNGGEDEEEETDGGDAGEAGNVIIKAGNGALGGEGNNGGSNGNDSPGGSVILVAGGGEDVDPGSIILLGKVYAGAEPTAQHYYNLDVRGNDTYVSLFTNTGTNWWNSGIKVQLASTANPPQDECRKFLSCFTPSGQQWTYRGGLIINDAGAFEFENASDASRKENIRSSTIDALRVVNQVRVADFRYIGFSRDCTGFIAQEMEAVYPEAVGLFQNFEIVTHHTPRTIPAGSIYNGEIVEKTFVADEVTTELVVTESCKTIRPLSLIPVLWRAVQQQQAEIAALKAAAPEDAARIAELEAALEEKVSVLDAPALQEALKDWTPDEKTMERIVDGVLAELGVNPWVEISFSEAWEEAAETTPVEVVQLVTKFRISWETMTTEPYTVEETVVEQSPTGRIVKRLKADVRFDEKANKFYRRVPLNDPALQAALPGIDKLLSASVRRLLANSTYTGVKSLSDLAFDRR